jgi:AcrR family transcriptional regulator
MTLTARKQREKEQRREHIRRLAERKQREKEQRREHILRAAERLFFSRSYDDVSMDEIATEAELSKATLYLYFKDKESLFFAVVNRGIKILCSIIKEEKKHAADLVTALISGGYGRFLKEYPDHAKAYFYFRSGRFDLSHKDTLSADAQEILALFNTLVEMLLSSIKRGIEDGVVRSDVNPGAVAVLYMLIAEGLLNMSPDLRGMLEDNGLTMQQVLTDVAELARHMVMYTGAGMNTMGVRHVERRSKRRIARQNDKITKSE